MTPLIEEIKGFGGSLRASDREINAGDCKIDRLMKLMAWDKERQQIEEIWAWDEAHGLRKRESWREKREERKGETSVWAIQAVSWIYDMSGVYWVVKRPSTPHMFLDKLFLYV